MFWRTSCMLPSIANTRELYRSFTKLVIAVYKFNCQETYIFAWGPLVVVLHIFLFYSFALKRVSFGKVPVFYHFHRRSLALALVYIASKSVGANALLLLAVG